VVLSLFYYDAPLEHHADPRKTPLDTQAPWFFLWIQGLLKLGDKTLMGVFVPVLLFTGLCLIPYFDRTPRRILRKRPAAILFSTGAIAGLIILSYMGTHYYGISLPPASRIMQTLAPEEGIGPFRKVPHDQLAVGIYPTAETDTNSLQPALADVFIQFREQVEVAEKNGRLAGADGIIVIEDWQANLKRVTLRILWIDPLDGERKTVERILHLHRDRIRNQD
jgi:hypothetical protein